MNVEQNKIFDCTIMRGVVGSTAHGLNLPGTDDRDEMGVCIEPLEYVAGFSEFEQLIYRSAAVRDQRHDAKSQPGDLDLVIYSLRKYVRLALKGNPTIVGLLFLPEYSVLTGYGSALKARRDVLLSRRAGRAFLGYMVAQRQRLIGERGGKHGSRLVDTAIGYDTKYAMHMLRLGFQGVELLRDGYLSLPMTGDLQDFLMNVRNGYVPLNDILRVATDLEHELKNLLDTSVLPEKPDDEGMEKWVIDTYRERWGCGKAI